MRPAKLSAKVFLEVPPILSHYLETERNTWLESNPSRGAITLLNRSGAFFDLEALAVERRHELACLGLERFRALRYRIGFEQGRRDGHRHLSVFNDNARVALQASLIFGQLQGRFVSDCIRFEFDLEQRTLYREVAFASTLDSTIHRMSSEIDDQCVCWTIAGYLSGHVSEILGRRIVTLETECVVRGHAKCRMISRLDSEWGDEANWVRDAIKMESVEQEVARKDALIAGAQRAARTAQVALTGLQRRLKSDMMLDNLVAGCEPMNEACERAAMVATSDAPVLIEAEPATGRECFARAIHGASARKAGPFIKVQCEHLDTAQWHAMAGLRDGLAKDTGFLAKAEGGTLYLSSLDTLPLEAQSHLAEFMQQARETTPAFRLMASVDGRGDQLVKEGLLHEKMYYLLSVARLALPPLRDRGTDILRLAERFVRESRERYQNKDVELSDGLKRMLLECAWPGNIDQLKNAVEHAYIMCRDGLADVGDLPEEILAVRAKGKPKELSEEVIRAALNRAHGNRSEAADMLGVGRTTLWRAMKRFGME
jgi:DNA-binding NtrC family response regulator